MNNNIYFLTFADKRWKESKQRFTNDLQYIQNTSNYFKDYFIYNEEDCPAEYQNRYKQYYSDHGFAWWSWKPYIIELILSKIGSDNILFYLDGGCSLPISNIKPFLDNLNMYINTLQYFDIAMTCNRTRMEEISLYAVLKYYNLHDDVYFKTLKLNRQSGVLLIKNNKKTANLIKAWKNFYDLNYNIFHTYKKANESSVFLKNCADQSVLNCLLYKMNFNILDITNFIYANKIVTRIRR